MEMGGEGETEERETEKWNDGKMTGRDMTGIT
jgi:hypothetical protein